MAYPYQITSAEQYRQAYQESVEEPEKFWAAVAASFQWRKKWDKVLEWNFREPSVKWFLNGN
jgi:acetyl-CoA synthetase